jgi:hypothetical protein
MTTKLLGMKAHNADLGNLKYYIGWYVSRKLNGYAALWDGGITRGDLAEEIPWYNRGGDWRRKEVIYSTGLWTLDGKVIKAPNWWLDMLPSNIPIHGELWADDNKSISAVSRSLDVYDTRWSQLLFMVYNVKPYECWCMSPEASLHINNSPWHIRMAKLQGIENATVTMLKQEKVTSVDFLQEQIAMATAYGWEGLMLINPDSYYECKRSHNLVKIKPVYDYEATVISYIGGKGKYAGHMGALVVEVTWDDQVTSFHGGRKEFVGKRVRFNVGGGFSDSQRDWNYVKEYFPAGAQITINFQEVGVNGCPPTAIYGGQA